MDENLAERCELTLQNLACSGNHRSRVERAWTTQLGVIHPGDFSPGLRKEFESIGAELTRKLQSHGSVEATLGEMTDDQVTEVTERIVALVCDVLLQLPRQK